jgi:hypothetical protein
MLKAEGTHALYVEGLSIRTETVAAARGRRPWVPDHVIVSPPWPVPSGQAYVRGDERADEDADKRFNGNPEH